LLGGLLTLAGGGRAAAQAKPAATEAVVQRARQLADKEEYPQAEQACLDAIKDAGGDANPSDVARWGRLENELVEVQIRMYKFREARERLAAALPVLQRPVAAGADDAGRRFELARAHGLLAAWAETCGRNAERLSSLRAAVAVLEKLAAEDPRRLEYGAELLRQKRAHAAALMTLGRFQESEAAYNEALKLGRRLMSDFPAAPRAVQEYALTCHNYGLLAREWGRAFEAARLMSEGIGHLAKLHREHGDGSEYWHELPAMHRNLAQVLASMGYTVEAAAANRGALRWGERLARQGSGAKKDAADAAVVPASLQGTGAATEPKSETERALAQAETAAREHPEVPRFRTRVVTAKGAAAMRLLAEGSRDKALRCAREMAEGADEVAAHSADVPTYQGMRADGRLILGMMQLRCGDAAGGEQTVREGLKLARDLAEANPEDPSIRYHVASETLTAATVFGAAGEADRARGLFNEAVAELEKLTRAHPKCPLYRRQLAETTVARGRLAVGGGDEAAAEAAYREGIGRWRQVAADFPSTGEFGHGLATALLALAGFMGRSDRHAEAEALVAEALRVHRGLAEAAPDRPEYRVALAEDYALWAQVKERQRQRTAAAEGYTQAIVLLDAAVKAVPSRRGWLGKVQDVLRMRADVLVALGKDAEAEADRKRVGELEETIQSPAVRLVRIEGRLDQGQLEPAVREADDLFLCCDVTAWQYHQLAGVYARAAGSPGAADKEAWAARAVESLRRAYEGGYRSSMPPDRDTQFQALAGRADFRELAAEKWK
jgi:tetratricopeptide (TPR) repeat protein